MARQVILELDGERSVFGIEKHAREKVYGLKKRVVVDEEGRECGRALLSEDGTTLLPPGCTADLYLDEELDVVERSDLRAVNAEGVPVPPVASTLGVATVLTGPVPYARVLDFVTPVVYRFDPETLGERLKAGLARGEVYESTFAYRDGFDAQTLLVVQNDTGVFGLVGRPTGFTWVVRATPPPTDADEPEFDDDLDFGML